jgi:hypothetical protein
MKFFVTLEQLSVIPSLIKMGFKLCVANKMINDKQCMVACYVDDNTSSKSHSIPSNSFFNYFTAEFSQKTGSRPFWW